MEVVEQVLFHDEVLVGDAKAVVGGLHELDGAGLSDAGEDLNVQAAHDALGADMAQVDACGDGVGLGVICKMHDKLL